MICSFGEGGCNCNTGYQKPRFVIKPGYDAASTTSFCFHEHLFGTVTFFQTFPYQTLLKGLNCFTPCRFAGSQIFRQRGCRYKPIFAYTSALIPILIIQEISFRGSVLDANRPWPKATWDNDTDFLFYPAITDWSFYNHFIRCILQRRAVAIRRFHRIFDPYLRHFSALQDVTNWPYFFSVH